MIAKARYAVRELSENWSERAWWNDRANHRVNEPLHRRVPITGHDVLAADWDNLVVLDACRTDLFEEVVDLTRFDEYRREWSAASATPDWVGHHFADRTCSDTVYVTGNPQVTKYAANSFHHLEDVWKTDFSEAEGTVLPEPVREAALDTHETYPNKRLVVHFMQPHQPFPGHFEDLCKNPWHACRDGELDAERLWEAYRDTLEDVLEELWTLVDELDGKTMITSDHGNLLGERLLPVPNRGYGHPPGLQHPSLRRVPCGVLKGERRQITDGRINASPTPGSEITDRLRQLGYK